MTVGELLRHLDGLDESRELFGSIDGIQAESVTKPRPILGVATVDETTVLIVGARVKEQA